jgi:hypothetical protein
VEEVTAEAAPENGWVVSSGEAEKDLCSNPRGPEEAVWGGVAITPALTPPPPPAGDFVGSSLEGGSSVGVCWRAPLFGRY